MEGWIKLHRKIIEKAFYCKDSEKVHLWIHLLIKANFSNGKEEFFGGKPYICKSGQFTTGRKQLSIETGISESKIERILTYFEKIEQQIEQQKTSTNRLISILNWEQYQQSEQQSEQQVNNDRTTSEQRVNTLKECKELKNDKNERNVYIAEKSFFEIKKDILASQQWKESFLMNYKCNEEYLNSKLNEFFIMLENTGDTDKTEKEIKYYFTHWLKKKYPLQSKTNQPTFDPARQYIDENGKIQVKVSR